MTSPCQASRVAGRLAALLLAGAIAGCGLPLHDTASGVRVLTAAPPSTEEEYCAWYGSRAGELLYFGQSAFWSAMRANKGDPRADLDRPGPQPIGRFDLRTERMLEAIDVGRADSRSGIWDVLVREKKLWYTTFFEAAGLLELETGQLRRFPELGVGLNEWTAGPARSVLVTRYGDGQTRSGSVLMLGTEGTLRAEWPLPNPPKTRIAAKTPGWDGKRARLWLSSDALTRSSGEPAGHPSFILDLAARSWQRRDEPELQFVAFDSEDTGYRAELQGRRLELVVEPAHTPARRLLLDADFPGAFDFVQDIQPAADGRVVVTRWSGHLHILDPRGALRDIQLPKLREGGLYYSAVLWGKRVCATYCAGVRVVCADAA